MPRSAKAQAAIDKYRNHPIMPKKVKEAALPTRSWWLDKDFYATAREEQKRMAPAANIVGNHGVLYGG